MSRFVGLVVSVHGLALVALVGCSTLEGDWEGDFDCGEAGTYAIEVDIGKAGKEYKGDGKITDFCIWDNEYYTCWESEFSFDVEVRLTKPTGGAQEIDMDLDDGELHWSGDGGNYDADCTDPDDVDWDGKDEIVGEVDDFYGNKCEFELER